MPSSNLDRLCSTGVLHAEPAAAGEYSDIDVRFVADLIAACARVAAKIQVLPPP